jgi:hypothetical protein
MKFYSEVFLSGDLFSQLILEFLNLVVHLVRILVPDVYMVDQFVLCCSSF